MNLKKLTMNSLLLAIGYVLHQIVPPIFFGMKTDFMLAMMFIAILTLDDNDNKSVFAISIAAGIITAATSTFPGGQIANIVDKLITGQVIFIMNRIFVKRNLNSHIKLIVISIVGTLVSGCIFLGTALLVAGLPAPLFALILTVVLPATIVNCFATVVLYKIVNTAIRVSRVSR